MLYFLLIIIAIGVLLASPAGQQLLGLLLILALIIGGLYLAFCVVVLGIGFLTTDTGQGLLGFLGIMVVLFGGNYLIKNIRNKVINKYPKIIPFWEKHRRKIKIIVLIVSIIFFTLLLVWATQQ
jgi:hypothetical protein